MPYYKFNKNDVHHNTLKTFPSVKFLVYSGSAYYNSVPNISGNLANPIRLTDSGHISLYEMNVNRVSSSTKRFIGPQYPDPDNNPTITGVPDNGLVYSFVTKNGARIGFRSMASTVSWNEDQYGTGLYGNYPYTASISKEWYPASMPRFAGSPIYNSDSDMTGAVAPILALKNTINHYGYLNPHFEYSSSARNFDSIELGLVNIPSIFYGSAIKKGTVDLKYYITGTLIARAQDKNQDGVLYGTYGETSGTVIGLALYNEGFLILTSSQSLSTNNQSLYTGPSVLSDPRWTVFAQSLSGSVWGTVGEDSGPGPDPAAKLITAPSASFILEMSGTSKIQTLTMLATARKGQLNQSTNPTFIKYTTNNSAASSSQAYIENNKIEIKNVVSSSYPDPTGSFEKTTYISKVGVYDENKNLIAIAKVATPVKKTAERDFTFKIKLDI
jgi:hypothetical protein